MRNNIIFFRGMNSIRLQIPNARNLRFLLVIVIAIFFCHVQSFVVKTVNQPTRLSNNSCFILNFHQSKVSNSYDVIETEMLYCLDTHVRQRRGATSTSLFMSRRQHLWLKSKQKFHKIRHSLRRNLFFWIRIDDVNAANNLTVSELQPMFIVNGHVGAEVSEASPVISHSVPFIEKSTIQQSEIHTDSDTDVSFDEVEIQINSPLLSSSASSMKEIASNDSDEISGRPSITVSSYTATLTRDDISSEVNPAENTKTVDEDLELTIRRQQQHKVMERPSRVQLGMTDLEIEFDNMIGELYFSPYDMASIANPRVGAILEGIIASDHEPAVYRAFQVLFEDLYPLRVAGRLIFKTLKSFTEESAKHQREDIARIVSETELEPEEIQEMRLMFVSVAAKLNGDLYITREQITTDPEFLDHVATEVMALDNVQELFDQIFRDKSDKLQFCDLMIGLQNCVEETCGLDHCDPQEVLKQLFAELQEKMPLAKSWSLDPSRKKFNDRYDEMVRTFVQWKHLIPQTGTGRRLDVVRGCFVGADNIKVVEALRTVYVDYSAFRFAGDIIFKLVSSVLKMRGASM